MSFLSGLLPSHGIYGHIQRNNAKSLLLLGAFVILFEALIMSAYTVRLAQIGDMASGGGGLYGKFANRIIAQIPVEKTPGFIPSKSEPKVVDKRNPVNDMLESPFMRSLFRSLWWQTLIYALIWVGVAWAFMRRAIARDTDAAAVTRREEPRLYNIVENLCITAGVALPSVYVMETRACNAYALGLTTRDGMIAVSRGLLDALNDRELEAVIAHELSHIRNGDTRLVSIAAIFSGVLMRMAMKILEPFAHPGRALILYGLFATMFFWLSLAVLVWACAVIVIGGWLTQFAITRTRDFIADASAIELTKDPGALASALRKIAGRESLGALDSGVEAMLFASAERGVFATQPSPVERIEALRVAAPELSPNAVAPAPRRPLRDYFTRAALKRALLSLLDVKRAHAAIAKMRQLATRSPKWVASRAVMFVASVLSFGATAAVARVVDPPFFNSIYALTRMTWFGKPDKSLAQSFGLPEDMFMTFGEAEKAKVAARGPAAACFPLNYAEAYEPGIRPFTPPKVDDETALNHGMSANGDHGLFFAWRHRRILLATLNTCPAMTCTGKELESYKDSLKHYLQSRTGLVRRFDVTYGEPGLAFAQNYFASAQDEKLMSDLRQRLAQGRIDPHDFPELYDALLIAAKKPPGAFRPCRTNAEWRASAFPAANTQKLITQTASSAPPTRPRQTLR